MIGGRATAVAGHKRRGTGGANDGAPLLQNTAHIIPLQGPDSLAPLNHALIAFINCVDFGSLGQRQPRDGAYGCIHTLRIAAAGENADSFHNIMSLRERSKVAQTPHSENLRQL